MFPAEERTTDAAEEEEEAWRDGGTMGGEEMRGGWTIEGEEQWQRSRGGTGIGEEACVYRFPTWRQGVLDEPG